MKEISTRGTHGFVSVCDYVYYMVMNNDKPSKFNTTS